VTVRQTQLGESQAMLDAAYQPFSISETFTCTRAVTRPVINAYDRQAT
jgi:hypothetical protein